MSENKNCIYCFESIPIVAKKCRYCLEIQDLNAKKDNSELIKEVLSLIGKSFIPIVALIIVFSFKPTIENLLSKTNEAEIFGGKFKFSQESGFKGEFTGYELYYLIDSADHGPDYQGGLNYESLKSNDPEKLAAITSLETKGLITSKIFDNEDSKFFKKSLTTYSTPKGKKLLTNLGIKF